MLSFKYIYRNLVKLGRPGDRVLAEQPQLDSMRRVPVPSGTDLAPLTQVRRSLITVYKSGRTGSKLIDHITRAVYKEWRYRSSEYPDVKAPLQTACSSIASGVNSTVSLEMEAVNGLIERVHALLVSIGFLADTAYHLIAVLIVIEANPLQVFSTAPVVLPQSIGARNPLFPKDKEMRPYRVEFVDQVYLCARFLESNDDIRARMQREWDVFAARHADFAQQLAQLLSGPAPRPRPALKTTLETVITRRELCDLPPTYRPYMIALVMAAAAAGTDRLESPTTKRATTPTAGEAPTELAVDGNVAGHWATTRRLTVDSSSKLLAKKQLTRIRSVSGPKLCVQ